MTKIILLIFFFISLQTLYAQNVDEILDQIKNKEFSLTEKTITVNDKVISKSNKKKIGEFIYFIGKDSIFFKYGDHIEIAKLEPNNYELIKTTLFSDKTEDETKIYDLQFDGTILSFYELKMTEYTRTLQKINYKYLLKKKNEKLLYKNFQNKANQLFIEIIFFDAKNILLKNKEIEVSVHTNDYGHITVGLFKTDKLGKTVISVKDDYFLKTNYITLFYKHKNLESNNVLEKKYFPFFIKKILAPKVKDDTLKATKAPEVRGETRDN